jgi:hypothetical protein
MIDFKEKWEMMTARNKQLTIWGSVFGVIILVILLTAKEKPEMRKRVEPNQVKLIDVDTNEMDMEQLAGKNKLLESKLKNLTSQFEIASDEMRLFKKTFALNSEIAETPQILYDLQRKVQELDKAQKNQQLQTQVQTESTNVDDDDDLMFIENIMDDNTDEVQIDIVDSTQKNNTNFKVIDDQSKEVDIVPDNAMSFVTNAYDRSTTEVNTTESEYIDDEDGLSEQPANTSSITIDIPEKSKEELESEKVVSTKFIGAILPAGSLIPGIVISGVDAPTGKAADKGASASTIRITGPAILPNGERVDLEGCFITNDVRGDLATERAVFRPQRITCSLKEGIVDTALQGYVTGKDGSLGFRGKVINKQGSALLYAGLSGFVGGIGNAYGGGDNKNTISLTGGSAGFNLPDPSDAMKSGASQGLSASADLLSEYYKEQLDLLYPVIEIKPMILASVHLLQTVKLKLYE